MNTLQQLTALPNYTASLDETDRVFMSLDDTQKKLHIQILDKLCHYIDVHPGRQTEYASPRQRTIALVATLQTK